MIRNYLDTSRRGPDGLARRALLLLVSVVLLGLWLGNLATVGLAQGETKVRLDPLASEVQVGDTIRVDIVVEDVANLYGIDVRLSFDPALLEVQDADPGTAGVQIKKGAFPAPDFAIKNEADNGAGTIWYAVTQLNPTEPVSGSGVAASVTFKGLAGGTSSVAFTDQTIANRNGERITATTQDGQIVVLAAAVPTSTSTPEPPTEPPTAVPPTATLTSRPTSTPTIFPEPTKTPPPTPTSMSPTTAPPTDTPTAAPPTATPISRPTSAPTTVSAATETPLPTPTSTNVPAPTTQPEATEGEAPSSTPFPTVSPSSTSGILAKSLPYVIVVFLGAMAVAAILGVMWLRNR